MVHVVLEVHEEADVGTEGLSMELEKGRDDDGIQKDQVIDFA